MGVDLCALQAAVPQEGLDALQWYILLQKVCGYRVSQRVQRDVLLDGGPYDRLQSIGEGHSLQCPSCHACPDLQPFCDLSGELLQLIVIV